MATLESLKQALQRKAKEARGEIKQPLSDEQYSQGFDILVRDSEWTTYEEFIIPQLTEVLTSHFPTCDHLSVLEIGPGPTSVLGHLPDHLRRTISSYTAFEPNVLFADRMEEWLASSSGLRSSLHSLVNPPSICRAPFLPCAVVDTLDNAVGNDEKYDLILFCHSMYGMKPKHKFIERALQMLTQHGIVIVFHRDAALSLEGLVCHQSACFPTGSVRVPNEDRVLDCFAAFIAGFVVDQATQVDWRKECRSLGRQDEAYPNRILFRSPNVMITFNHHALSLPELTARVPMVTASRMIKNREARTHSPAAIMRPTTVCQVQQCVQWALQHELSLTVIGGSHGGQCLWPNIVAVDMSHFDKIHILEFERTTQEAAAGGGCLAIVESGCKTGDIISETMTAGVTIPLGSRPSVGAGLWLQGGIGHLARQFGLACDSIVGAVLVSAESGKVFYVGEVPSRHRPTWASRPNNENEILWAIRGAGTNFGIVINVTFRTQEALKYLARNWILPLLGDLDARLKLQHFDVEVASKLPQNCSADAYLYCEAGKLQLGITTFESFTNELHLVNPIIIDAALGPEHSRKVVDGVGLFDTEMYMSGMHGGHGNGKTSSFKRCLFLPSLGEGDIAGLLIKAIEDRPSPLCYFHLLHGGGAVKDIQANASAFGCREWSFACVITGVWPRDQDGTEAAWSAVEWVYAVAMNLLSASCGVYGADLGPDPRDATLATKAFGPNSERLAHMKHTLDPRNVLRYACPMPKVLHKQKLIILVSGESCVGKDFSAGIWVSVFNDGHNRGRTARAVSISDAIKKEYAEATGTSYDRLIRDRNYKEKHRPRLTAFFEEKNRRRPQLREETFLDVVSASEDVDVLIITGMRDKAPVARLSHLVPGIRLVEVHIKADKQTRRTRRDTHSEENNFNNVKEIIAREPDSLPLLHSPSLTFVNDETGSKAARAFAKHHLLPFIHEDLERLASMVHSSHDFPRPGIEFRHVLGISEQSGGLSLCTSLLESHFVGDWSQVHAIVSCEIGGFIFASALAARVDVRLALVRQAGKLPPPTISVTKSPSNISCLAPDGSEEKRIEIEQNSIPKSASVVVVDDVLATGETIYAVIKLLMKAGIGAEDISVMVVAEFPAHQGRNLLHQRGLGRIHVQSLLILDGL